MPAGNLPNPFSQTSDLYPPEADPKFTAFLHGISTGEFAAGNKLVIRRKLEPSERAALTSRTGVLDHWLQPGRVDKMTFVITTMLSGFGSKSANEEEAQVVAVQYQQACRLLPLWAVERSCSRWSSGSVQPSEVGVAKLDRSYAPSSAQLAMVAQALARKLYEERQLIKNVLGGVLHLGQRPTDPAELAASKEKVRLSNEEFQRRPSSPPDDAPVLTAEQREKNALRLREGNERLRRQQFTAAGVEPPDDDHSSLPALLSLGWTIEQHPEGGGKILVAPPGVSRKRA